MVKADIIIVGLHRFQSCVHENRRPLQQNGSLKILFILLARPIMPFAIIFFTTGKRL